MVSKRQKIAKKKFKEQHPELFPTPEPTPPKDPSKKKKKKQPNFKKLIPNKTNNRINKNNKPRKLLATKRPSLVRVPGLKPGDSCFICKELHVAKNCPKKAEWERNKICLFCRQRGHSLKNCPGKTDEVVEEKLCYNCGESGHSLSRCPYPMQDGGTKFALCFVCKERGHLSKDCPKNDHGIYPKGGCCKICGGVTHLARDCPNKGSRGSISDYGRGSQPEQPRPQHTKFYGGDDLEDDFMIEEVKDSKKSQGDLASQPNHSLTKLKKKQEPKVVNFVG